MDKHGRARLHRSVQGDLPDLEAIRRDVVKQGFAELADAQMAQERRPAMTHNADSRKQENERMVRETERRGSWGKPPRGPRFWIILGAALAAVVAILVFVLPQIDRGGLTPTDSSSPPVESQSGEDPGIDSTRDDPVDSEPTPPDNQGAAPHSEPTDPVDMSASTTALPAYLGRDGGAFRVTNTGEGELAYGLGYRLMQKVDGEWVDLEMKQDMIVTTIALVLEPGASDYIYANWEPYYGSLYYGEYRYVNGALTAEFMIDYETRPGAGYAVPPREYRTEMELMNEDSDLVMSVELGSEADLASVPVTLSNTGTDEITFGKGFFLLREVPLLGHEPQNPIERWGYVQQKPDIGFEDIGYILPPGDTLVESFNMSFAYDIQEAGLYRMVLSASSDAGVELVLSEPFLITPEMLEQEYGIIYQDDSIVTYRVPPNTSEYVTTVEAEYVPLVPESVLDANTLVASGLVSNLEELQTYYYLPAHDQRRVQNSTHIDFEILDLLHSDRDDLASGDTVTALLEYNSYYYSESSTWPHKTGQHLFFFQNTAELVSLDYAPRLDKIADYHNRMPHALVFPNAAGSYVMNSFFQEFARDYGGELLKSATAEPLAPLEAFHAGLLEMLAELQEP